MAINEKLMQSYQQQKNGRRRIEDFIPEYLDGDIQKNMLDFAAWLRANKMSPGWAGFTNAWKATNKGRTICYMHLGAGGASNIKEVKFVVAAFLENIGKYEETVISEDLQNLLWDNVFYCVQKPPESLPPEESRHYALTYPCNIWNCAPGKNITVCEKELTNICRNGNRQHFWFHDPDGATLDSIKKLLELEQIARKNENK